VLSAMASNCTPIPPPTAAAAGAPTITAEEVHVAIKRTPRSKVPGPDSIPAEVWAACSDFIAPLLASLFTAVGETGCTPAGFRDGLVTPLHKDGCKATISNYRPITLLNTDYRLLSKCLAHRWGPALAQSIGPEQTAFMPGRLMGESILLLQLLPHALAAQEGGTDSAEGAAAFLDFSKAYDTVDRGFLLRAMEIGGGAVSNAGAEQQQHLSPHQHQHTHQQPLPHQHTSAPTARTHQSPIWDGTAGWGRTARTAGMVGWAHILLGNTRASAVVNGWVSQPRQWEAGVRQGCPLAPAMYLFVAWALHCWLQTIPEVGLNITGRRVCASQYADDCVALLGSCTEGAAQALRDAMATFSGGTGQHLNLSKSSLLPLGRLPRHLPTSLCGVPVRPHARTLGISFTNPQVQRDQHQQQQHNHQQQQREHLQLLRNAQAEEWAALTQRHQNALQRVQLAQQHSSEALWDRFNRLRSDGSINRHQLERLSQSWEQEDEALSAQQQAERGRIRRVHEGQKHSLKQQHQSALAALRARAPPHSQEQSAMPGEVNWEQVLEKVRHKCSKLTRLSLSAFGRAFGVSGYALSSLLFYAEFSGLPTAVQQQVHRLVTATVEGDNMGNGRGSGGVPSALHMGSPKEGGLGLLPWPQHITARHARWAHHLVHHISQPRPCSSTPPWVLAAAAVLQARGPLHPAQQLLPPHSYNHQPPLPPPLARMAVALQQLTAPNPGPTQQQPPTPPLPHHQQQQQQSQQQQQQQHQPQHTQHTQLQQQHQSNQQDRQQQRCQQEEKRQHFVRSATASQLGGVREARCAAWHRCAEDAVALTHTSPILGVPLAPGLLVEQLQRRVKRVWGLRWGNRWKEMWWRLLLHGVKGAGGHGWAWARERVCVCGWHPSHASDGPTRAFQQRAHVFWECPCAQAVVQCVRERLGGAPVLPVHVWLFAPPPRTVGEREWYVLALAALNAMAKFRGVFASGGEEQVRVRSHDLLDGAWQDFVASQL